MAGLCLACAGQMRTLAGGRLREVGLQGGGEEGEASGETGSPRSGDVPSGRPPLSSGAGSGGERCSIGSQSKITSMS